MPGYSKLNLVLFIFLLSVFLTLPVLPVFAAIPDQRFGLSGRCDFAKELNIPWFYDWGTDSEVPCAQTEGRKAYLTVGSIDVWSCEKQDLSQLKIQGLLDNEDNILFTRLNNLLTKYEGRVLINARNTPDYGGNKVCQTQDWNRKRFLEIGSRYWTEMPGAFYQIGNEPDWYAYMTPDDYAEIYNIFYTRIKKYDPSAKVITGGITSFSPLQYNDSNNFNYSPNDHFKWIREFREAYKNKFGSFPKVDVWNIHTYHPSDRITGSSDWNLTKNMIIDFRDNFLTNIGEPNAPVWISEFGLLVMEGAIIHPGSPCQTYHCLSSSEQEQEWNMVANDFMKPLVSWMKSNNYIQKWFWYMAAETSSSGGGPDQVTDVYKQSDGQFNPIGRMYKQLAEEDTDKIPNCSITSGPIYVNIGQPATYTINFSANPGNLGGNMSIGQNGQFLKDIEGKWSSWSSTSGTATFTWTPDALGAFDLMCRTWNDGIAECRGNPVYVDQMPRYECAGPNAYMTVNVVNSTSPSSTPIPTSSSTQSPKPTPVPGDINGDGKVDFTDYYLFTSYFGQTGSPGFTSADIDKNGVVDIFDYNILVGNWGK